jgi:hypothetical protein
VDFLHIQVARVIQVAQSWVSTSLLFGQLRRELRGIELAGVLRFLVERDGLEVVVLSVQRQHGHSPIVVVLKELVEVQFGILVVPGA